MGIWLQVHPATISKTQLWFQNKCWMSSLWQYVVMFKRKANVFFVWNYSWWHYSKILIWSGLIHRLNVGTHHRARNPSQQKRRRRTIRYMCSPINICSPSFLACREVLKSPSKTICLAMGVCAMVSSSTSKNSKKPLEQDFFVSTDNKNTTDTNNWQLMQQQQQIMMITDSNN